MPRTAISGDQAARQCAPRHSRTLLGPPPLWRLCNEGLQSCDGATCFVPISDNGKATGARHALPFKQTGVDRPPFLKPALIYIFGREGAAGVNLLMGLQLPIPLQ